MKTPLKILFAAALLLVGTGVSAQNAKLGYTTDAQAVMSELPEMAEANKNLQAFAEELSKQGNALNTEFSNLYQDYNKKAATYTDAIRTEKENELNSMRERLEQFQEKAEQDFNEKRAELMQPVFLKLRNAIEAVAKAGGYAYIFDATGVLYINPALATDVTAEIKKELGL